MLSYCLKCKKRYFHNRENNNPQVVRSKNKNNASIKMFSVLQ